MDKALAVGAADFADALYQVKGKPASLKTRIAQDEDWHCDIYMVGDYIKNRRHPAKVYIYPWEEAPVDAVLFTHYHGDHVGRILDIPDNIPLYIGETARKVMLNIHEY